MATYKITLLSFATTVVVIATLVVTVCRSAYMPAPRISASSSFNEKALWLRQALRRRQRADILIVGSSMGVNNVDDGELAEITGTKDIVNASAFGLSMDESWRLTRELLDRFHPKLVILPVFYGDFWESDDMGLDWEAFRECLGAHSLMRLYAMFPDVLYYETNYFTQKSEDALNRKSYYSLNFDSFGGVLLNPDHFTYDPKRWDEYKKITAADIKIAPGCLKSLREMSAFLTSRRVTFLVVACPMRQPAEQKFSSRLKSGLWANVQTALKDSNGLFLHICGGQDFDDSLFVDFCHLNAVGAKKMTDALAPTLRRIYRGEP